MKSILTLIAASSLLAALAVAQPPRYILTDLGTLPGGNFSQASYVGNDGIVTGVSTLADGTQHAVLWQAGQIIDLATRGFGGPNSLAGPINEFGQVAVQAEVSAHDPHNENFCGYGTGLQCRPFLVEGGLISPLPTLGGNNGSWGGINRRGEVAGFAENTVQDPNCPSGAAMNGTGPQVLDYEAVIWGPRWGEIRELHPLAGDTVGIALWINDKGQTVGVSGTCANTVIPPISAGPHAVLWDKDGTVHDLGNLGGTANPAVLGIGNVALSINNEGQVVGASALSGSMVDHAFLWSKKTGIQDLGTLSGDVGSAGLAINDRGEVVGQSMDAKGNSRAILWQDGVMTDLNSLVPADSPLYLLLAFGINSYGAIAGFGVQPGTGDLHAYLATPCDFCAADTATTAADLHANTERPKVVLSGSERRVILGRQVIGGQ